MSYNDLWIRDLGARYGVALLAILAIVFWMASRWPKMRESWYRDYLIGFEVECSDLAAFHKRRLFEPLHCLISADETLRDVGRIRILEIGVKTGENIAFYPDDCHLVGVDLNKRLADHLFHDENAWRFRHIFVEQTIVGDGSRLGQTIPSGSVDAVVTTRTLCSVESPAAVLREIRRVLVQGGTYFFMEHTPDPRQGTLIRWLQMFWSRSGIWPSLYGGCRPDFDPIPSIEMAGFEQVTWRRAALHGDTSRPHHLALTRHHIIGTAIR
ncbi:putative methyltransferase-like protein 7A [Athalia rosae]|uniref:putative methyltransferase-like protein 7A n=1 Tax=Athalia rosae TaxID=37344 RepID=UPI000626BD42|nr:putative methyltransferase-like protein 7A [Athalia rosae]